MNQKKRHYLFLFFVLLFLIITSLLTLYANGYKINLRWPLKLNQTLQKTGMFIFDTKPEGAKIYIDGKAKKYFFKNIFQQKEKSFIRTPAKIKNILPGEYEIKIEKKGYWPWIKKLKIQPGQLTYAETIYLFKKEVPLMIENLKNNKNIKIYEENNYIIIQKDKELIILNKKNNKTTKIEIGDNIKSLALNILNQEILVNNKIFNLETGKKINDLSKFISENIKKVKFNPKEKNKIYYIYNNQINSFNLQTKENKVLTTKKNFLDYCFIQGNELFFIYNENKKTKASNAFKGNNNKIINIELFYSDDYKFLKNKNKKINIYDKKHKKLYIIDPFSNLSLLKCFLNDIEQLSWIDDNNLIYANKSEIWFLNTETKKKEILARLSKNINNIIWHPSNNYILYSTARDINIMELDEREKRNITKIISLNNVSNLFINEKGDIIFFKAKIGRQEGFYKLYIQ